MQISTIRGRVSGRRRLNLGGNAQDGEQSKAGTDVATGYGARTAVIGWVGAWVTAHDRAPRYKRNCQRKGNRREDGN